MASAGQADGRPADHAHTEGAPVLGTNFVYYLRRAGRVKIGWTGDLKARMRVLRPDELLAVEPGCRHIEKGRHHQFHSLRLRETDGIEWFTAAEPLLAHIAQMARLYPTPALDELVPVNGRNRYLAPPSIPPVPHDEARALLRWDGLRRRPHLKEVPDDDLRQGMTDEELVTVNLPEWSGQLVAALRCQGVPWLEIERRTGVSKGTLIRRATPYLEELT